MVLITRNQRDYLEENGCIFERDLHRTIGKGKKKSYYATENKRVMTLLERYKKEVESNN